MAECLLVRRLGQCWINKSQSLNCVNSVTLIRQEGKEPKSNEWNPSNSNCVNYELYRVGHIWLLSWLCENAESAYDVRHNSHVKQQDPFCSGTFGLKFHMESQIFLPHRRWVVKQVISSGCVLYPIQRSVHNVTLHPFPPLHEKGANVRFDPFLSIFRYFSWRWPLCNVHHHNTCAVEGAVSVLCCVPRVLQLPVCTVAWHWT
jgi:hypothetical protein